LLPTWTRLAVGTLRASARDLLLIVAAVVFVPATASAGDVDAARKTFAEGVKLYQQGDWEGARRLFKKADTEHHAPAIVYNLALAEEKLGHLQAALDAYEAYIAEVGDKGELSSPAVLAIAQIKARTTKLRVETNPPGARLFVDGVPLTDPSPTSFLVGGGHHVVIAQGDGWRAERDVEAKGAGDALTVNLAKTETAPPAPTAPLDIERTTPPPSGPEKPIEKPPVPEPPKPAGPEGIVWGAEFAIVPCYLLAVTKENSTNAKDVASIVAGPVLEIGYALTEDFLFVGRGFVGVGPDAKPSYAFMGGPGLSYRLAKTVWLGASFIGGQLETKGENALNPNESVRYGTDLVFGALAEVNAILIKKKDGEWVAGFQPAFLLTKRSLDNTTFFFPLSFGYRAY
jgi:hypothetical protein